MMVKMVISLVKWFVRIEVRTVDSGKAGGKVGGEDFSSSCTIQQMDIRGS